jgi:hypothetical protein
MPQLSIKNLEVVSAAKLSLLVHPMRSSVWVFTWKSALPSYLKPSLIVVRSWDFCNAGICADAYFRIAISSKRASEISVLHWKVQRTRRTGLSWLEEVQKNAESDIYWSTMGRISARRYSNAAGLFEGSLRGILLSGLLGVQLCKNPSLPYASLCCTGAFNISHKYIIIFHFCFITWCF